MGHSTNSKGQIPREFPMSQQKFGIFQAVKLRDPSPTSLLGEHVDLDWHLIYTRVTAPTTTHRPSGLAHHNMTSDLLLFCELSTLPQFKC